MSLENVDLEAQLLRTIDRLSSEFEGMFGRETVERFARERSRHSARRLR